MAENKNNKKKYCLPKDGSEDPHPLLIPLQNFQFRHDTYTNDDNSDSKDSEDFIGRDSLIEQLIKLLENTTPKRGSYLVAGYRGAGKTCLINRVINIYKKDKKNVVIAKINLGHDAVLDTRHVLFNIISVLNQEFKKNLEKNCKLPRFRSYAVLIVFCFFFWTLVIDYPQDLLYKQVCDTIETYQKSDPQNTVKLFSDLSSTRIRDYLNSCSETPTISNPFFYLQLLLGLIFICILNKSNVFRKFLTKMYYFFELGNSNKNTFYLYNKIQNLHDKVAYSFEKDMGILGLRSAGFGLKHKTKAPEMKEPQIELELNYMLELCYKCGYEIIFVFDELDKISLTVTDSNISYNSPIEQPNKFDRETLDENVYRRKKRVDSLLASLKTLITVGQAKFFFIAGREMLDSYQSEKGSTSSLYESLFNQVFEVPSFLTDDSDKEKHV